MKNLVLDFGNTNRKLGLFEEKILIDNYIYNRVNFNITILDEIWTSFQPNRIVISSTSHLSAEEKKWMSDKKVLEVSHELSYPFDILYTTPATLGRDRLAAVSAADSLYRGHSSLIIDAGTCITYDFISKEGQYIGGNIAPGIDMRLKAMNTYSDHLPLVSKENIPELLMGNSTESALQNGGIKMAIMEAEEIIRRLRSLYGDFNIILTGGDGDLFEKYLNYKLFVHPDLVLFGLNEILINNEV
ncbi:type III pantothenate kinase [Membranihabitans marinus]|uniref:type III pantothenate kinase n=1 Tax=Membranihabitans marinus TaxID=1227546 RepID=UPI001F023248|nr:type III pantothenate kinase [Membranihabitans marinus]